MKIIHTPYNEANNPFAISLAERLIGLDSKLIIFKNDGYFTVSDEVIFSSNHLYNEIKRWILLLRVIISYSHIHYNNGSFLSPPILTKEDKIIKKLYNKYYSKPLYGIDIKILSKVGKKIYVTFQGSDVRNVEYSRNNYEWHFAKEKEYKWNIKGEEVRKRKTYLFNKYSRGIFAVNPDLLNTLPDRAKYVPYASVFPSRFKVYPPSKGNGVLKVVHAPSNRIVKGTKYILKAINSLIDDGYPIELTLVEGLNNIEAVNVYQSADIVIDQILSGWYGALALEVMAMGKPVICYIRKDDLRHIPEQMANEMPLINSNPEDLYKQLKEIVNMNRHELEKLGHSSRKFVEKWHNPFRIAEYYMSFYNEQS